jgi:1-aminocyclopropane-1-carboxylate deaminase
MLQKFQRYPLTFGPTPIERLSRLSVHLGGQVDLYVKREDCNSGLAFGGNKLRKLEYIIPDAMASNVDTLVRSVAYSRTPPARGPLSQRRWV